MRLAVAIVAAALGLFLFIGLGLGASLPPTGGPAVDARTCGYDSCTKSDPKKLNIHLVAHTHDDVGWLKTVDQYYFGGRMNIQVAGVQYIIDSVVDALEQDPNRKFIYVETAFLWKWWQQQSEKKQEIMRKLINEGRLEIIGGAWSMNDEAVTHYHSVIDQFTWGFRRLNDTFGACARPKVGWQIDPFGHSREQASIFAHLGFDGMLFGRLDYQDKSKRLTDKTGEFIWKGSASLESGNLFTTMLYNNYGPPPGFCFDILCQDAEPMIDDADSPDYNIDKRLAEFLKFVETQAEHYRTNNVILTMGGDFTYQYAEMYFKNMDKLIRYVNERNGSDFNAFYSTPSCYLKTLNEQNQAWPVKTDDFFPYASDPHAFWTGYFSSRPTLKYFERMGNNFLQVVKQLSVLTNEGDSKELELFREAMGVMQHHDAVTGTEKQHVAEDYARLLHYSFRNGERLASKALNKWALKKDVPKPPEFQSCLLLNISACDASSDSSKFVVTVYNPTSQPLSTYVRVPAQQLTYRVRDFNGKDIVMQLVPIPDQVQRIPGRVSKATRELVFEAINIAPLGFQSFYVDQGGSNFEELQNDQPSNYVQTMGGEYYNISVDPQGKVVVRSLKSPKGLDFEQTFQYYEGAEGNNKVFANRSSGAYIFRPKQNYTKDLPNTGTFQIFKGPLVEEIHQVINDWVSQVVRIYNGKDYVEFDWLVGPIPVKDKLGKEIITKYKSNLKNNGEFYTDSNGREMLKRKLNYRPTWDLELQEPISGNYYPITTKLSIEDKESKFRLSALIDRAQGGSSLHDGEIELMVHRRLLSDDAFGVGEALNESAFGEGLVARGQHYLVGGSLTNLDEVILQEKELATQLALRPWIFVTPMDVSFNEWSEYYKMRDDGLIKKLPKNVQLLTLEPWKDGKVLVRLEHIFEEGESPKYSTVANVDLKELFSGFTVQSVEETVLGANAWVDEVHRLQWQAETNEVSKSKETSDSILTTDDSIIVKLKPMQIRTFVVKLVHATKFDA